MEKKDHFVVAPCFDDVRPSVDEVVTIMGYRPGTEPSFIPVLVENLIDEARNHSTAKGCYSIYKVFEIDIASGLILHEKGRIKCGHKIARQLLGSEYIALFAGTAGNSFDYWIKRNGSDKDIMSEYLCSSIGSVIADKVADLIQEEIRKTAEADSRGITNRYSPGYCNWDIRDQKSIFDLIHAEEIDVELTPSFLMKPIKSVSGMIGIGAGLQPGEYMCDICGMTDCLVKRAKGM